MFFASVYSRCVGRWGRYTTHQDGGLVAEDLCAPVQCGEDDAVWTIHASVWCLQNHQRESPRSPNRTRLVNVSEMVNIVYMIEIYRHLYLHTLFHFVFQASDYGLFLSDDDPRKGIWLESGRTLDYYMLRNGVRLSHSLGWRTVSCIYHLLKWFILSRGTWDIYVSLLAESDCSLRLRMIGRVVDVTVLLFLFSQDILEYKKKQRPQKIKMLDGAVKTIMVDDSKTVGELLVTICSRIGTQ